MRVHLQRKRTFSGAHRYGHPGHDAGWNTARFGRLTEVHGHNYEVTATIAGEVDPVTGIVVNLVEVKRWLETAVQPFDGVLFDAGSPAMGGRQSSTENLAMILWDRLREAMAGAPADLVSVHLAETDTLWSEYRGEGDVVFVTRVYDFSAAHRLNAEGLTPEANQRIFGKCNRPGGHGHNYVVEVTVKGEVDAETGFAYPLDTLDAAVERTVLDRMDHRNLNTDLPEFARTNPTTENVAIVIWNSLSPQIGAALYRVRVEETARNAFEYFGD